MLYNVGKDSVDDRDWACEWQDGFGDRVFRPVLEPKDVWDTMESMNDDGESMLRIHCTDNEYFDIGIVGYERADAEDEWWDANWLNVCVDIHSPRASLRVTASVLLTTDVREIIQWFEDLAAGRQLKWNPSRFIEPNLRIEHVGRKDNRWVVRFSFRAEFKPAGIPQNEDFSLTAELTTDDIKRITATLEKELSMYPERTGER